MGNLKCENILNFKNKWALVYKYKPENKLIINKKKEDMKFSLKLLTFLTILFFSHQSCSEDKKNDIDERENIFKVGNEEFHLSNGAIVYIEENLNSTDKENQYIIDLTLNSQGIDISSSENNNTIDFKGTGQKIWFALATSSKTELNKGIFNLNSDNVQHGSYCKNWIDEKDSTDENYWVELESGEIAISNDNEVYEISFECTNKEGESISGFYKGKLQYFTIE
jgi:hypothetical protein